MPAPPAIQIVPVDDAHRAAVLGLRVRPEQRAYVGAIADLLADSEACAGSTPLAIVLDGAPIGFVRIEADASSVAGQLLDMPTLGLRAFFIDQHHQHRGLGTRALGALLEALAHRYPHMDGVALAVDTGNAAALALYRRAGFAEVRGRYHGHPGQPQRLLWRALPHARNPCTTTSATSSN